jgi:hypothetical protein
MPRLSRVLLALAVGVFSLVFESRPRPLPVAAE